MENQASGDGALRWGILGTAIAALCCFTPVLVLLLGAVGLSWLVGYLDYVLWPALIFFVGLTLYALWRRQRQTSNGNDCACEPTVQPLERNGK